MGLFQKTNAVWQKVGIVQRGLLAAIVMACVITGVLLTKWAANADMQILYSGLSADSAGAIVDKIAEAGVEYQLRNGGGSIYVPSDQVYKLRLDMAKEGLPAASKSGYGIFDDEKIGVSPLVQQLNKNRAIQDELAKTIQMIDGVLSARVHITRPEETMFGGGSQEATAAVVLKVRPGWSIGASSVAAITHIVAGAVEGLGVENVTIADSTGLLTSKGGNNTGVGMANSFMDYKERVEQTIGGNLTDMLDKVLGPGRVSIKVSATVDLTSETVQTTLYEKGMAEEEIIDSGSTVLPGTTDSEGNELSAGSTEKSETITNKF
ncbi:MAG: flagellar M-ring protein FliF, partial [Planctomycetes bacterium]|nr:flagellar M-ring protein FliF [Planctomycetota bacterium]